MKGGRRKGDDCPHYDVDKETTYSEPSPLTGRRWETINERCKACGEIVHTQSHLTSERGP